MKDPAKVMKDTLSDIFSNDGTYRELGVDPDDLAFASITGSYNYDLHTKDSDVDMKFVYFPTFDHYFTGNFPRKHIVTDEIDYTFAPIHKVIPRLLNGGMSSFEVLYPKEKGYLEIYSAYHSVDRMLDIARKMVPMNAKSIFRAAMGVAQQKIQKAEHNPEGTFDFKSAAAAIHQMHFLYSYLRTGEIKLIHMGTPLCRDIKEGKVSKESTIATYNDLLHENEGIALVDVEPQDQFSHLQTWSNYMEKLDLTDSPRWKELESLLNLVLKDTCRARLR